MACDFSVIMNPGPTKQVMDASDVLDIIHELEQQLSVYKNDSEISRLNAAAFEAPVRVESKLFNLLTLAQELSAYTGDAFDLTSGPLISLWRVCRDGKRIPTQEEIDQKLQVTGMRHVDYDQTNATIRFKVPGVEINLGAIGKGYALDRTALRMDEIGLHGFLLHGGHSSLLARGEHNQVGGWPVGLGNPLFTDRRLGIIVLKDQAMSTSGSNIQYFRHRGKRYGHILDPRTGRPVEGMLSVTVVAKSAAVADALSTAFYVIGKDKTIEYCQNHPDVGAILIPFSNNDRRIRPTIVGIDRSQLFWDESQVLAN